MQRAVVGRIALSMLRPVRAAQDLFLGYRELRSVREIVAVKFWGVGNAALLLPVLAAVKRRYPAARLTVVTLERNRLVFQSVADRVLTVRFGMAPFDLPRVLAALRRDRADLALDFEQFVRASQVLLFLSGARQVIAFDTAGQNRAHLAEVRVPYDDTGHASRSFLSLARAAGVHETDYVPGGLGVDAEARERTAEWVQRAGKRPLVLVHPGSGDNFTGRRWPTRRFGLVARRLVDEHDAAVVVTGTRAERRLAHEVVEASERDLFDLSGRLPLADLIAFLDRAEMLISNDTGPVHLASALGTPVLGLYGPNTPLLYGPLSPGSRAFYDAPACSPCITNLNYKTSRCLNPVCIRAISEEEVAQAAFHLLSRDRAERRA